LSQVVDRLTTSKVILDLFVTNASELIGNAKTGGSLNCSDHALMQSADLRDESGED